MSDLVLAVFTQNHKLNLSGVSPQEIDRVRAAIRSHINVGKEKPVDCGGGLTAHQFSFDYGVFNNSTWGKVPGRRFVMGMLASLYRDGIYLQYASDACVNMRSDNNRDGLDSLVFKRGTPPSHPVTACAMFMTQQYDLILVDVPDSAIALIKEKIGGRLPIKEWRRRKEENCWDVDFPYDTFRPSHESSRQITGVMAHAIMVESIEAAGFKLYGSLDLSSSEFDYKTNIFITAPPRGSASIPPTQYQSQPQYYPTQSPQPYPPQRPPSPYTQPYPTQGPPPTYPPPVGAGGFIPPPQGYPFMPPPPQQYPSAPPQYGEYGAAQPK